MLHDVILHVIVHHVMMVMMGVIARRVLLEKYTKRGDNRRSLLPPLILPIMKSSWVDVDGQTLFGC
jgi:hypothetical protein